MQPSAPPPSGDENPTAAASEPSSARRVAIQQLGSLRSRAVTVYSSRMGSDKSPMRVLRIARAGSVNWPVWNMSCQKAREPPGAKQTRVVEPKTDGSDCLARAQAALHGRVFGKDGIRQYPRTRQIWRTPVSRLDASGRGNPVPNPGRAKGRLLCIKSPKGILSGYRAARTEIPGSISRLTYKIRCYNISNRHK
jgi:hypothetical protein